jgi:hypothetical protein
MGLQCVTDTVVPLVYCGKIQCHIDMVCSSKQMHSLFYVTAHRASVHSRTLGKAGTKQARTLELEFTLAPRPRGNAQNQRRPYSVSMLYVDLIHFFLYH